MTEEGITATCQQNSTTHRSRFPRILGFNRKTGANRHDHNHKNHNAADPKHGVEQNHLRDDHNNSDKVDNADKKKDEPVSDLKEIGLWYGGSLVMNAIVGLGIFGTPKGVLAEVGSVGMTLVIWTFTGIFSMFAALCFVELRESVRKEGVEYAYITEAFGPLAGFVYSWMRIAAAEPAATALFAMVFTDYLTDSIYDGCGPPDSIRMLLSILAILSMCLLNMMSTKFSERMQNLATLGKTCALGAIVVMGIQRLVNGKNGIINQGMVGTKLSQSNLVFACYNGLWAYGGWSQVNQVTSGIKKPPRNVPRIVKTVIPLVLLLYLMVVLSYFTAMSQDDFLNSRAIGMTWAKRVLGPAQSLVTVGVCLTALGSLNATFLSAGRLSSVAAKNGQMPDVASWVHVRSKTPILVVTMKAVIAMMVVCLATIQECLRFYIFCVWLFHGMSILALLLLRYKDKKKRRPYKVDLWIPTVVVIVIVYLLLIPFTQSPDNGFIAVVVLILLSLATYYPVKWIRAKAFFHFPDILTIWLQLFLRVAPKRDLRRERRRSVFNRYLAMDYMLHPENPVRPRTIYNQFISLRYPKEKDYLNNTRNALRRRTGSSLTAADLKEMATYSYRNPDFTDKQLPQNVLRYKSNGKSRSFNHGDVSRSRLPFSPSVPILKNRFNTTPIARKGSEPGALASPLTMGSQEVPSSFIYRSYRLHQNGHATRNLEPNRSPQKSENGFNLQPQASPNYPPFLQTVEVSDYGTDYEASFPHISDRKVYFDPESIRSNLSSSDDDNDSTSNLQNTIFASLFNSDSSSSFSSSEEEEISDDNNESIPSSFNYDKYTEGPRGFHSNVGFSIESDTYGAPERTIRSVGYKKRGQRKRSYNDMSPSQSPPKPRQRVSLLRQRPQPAPRRHQPGTTDRQPQPRPRRHGRRFPYYDDESSFVVSYV